jgi:hypothetical protein
VERFAVNLAENRYAANAQLAAGAQDAHGDFPAIGNQDFPEHGPLALLRDSSTGDIAAKPLALRKCLIVSSRHKPPETPQKAASCRKYHAISFTTLK